MISTTLVHAVQIRSYSIIIVAYHTKSSSLTGTSRTFRGNWSVAPSPAGTFTTGI